jgi:hypothetical protein
MSNFFDASEIRWKLIAIVAVVVTVITVGISVRLTQPHRIAQAPERTTLVYHDIINVVGDLAGIVNTTASTNPSAR